MQLRLKRKTQFISIAGKRAFRIILSVLIFLGVIYFLGQIDMPKPNKLIKHQISNDKLIRIK